VRPHARKEKGSGWAPHVSERGGENKGDGDAGWALMGRIGHVPRVSIVLFYPYFPKNINKYTFKYL
jgi:hypothetical protein